MTNTYTPTVWEDEAPASTPVKYSITDDTNGVLAASAEIAPVTTIAPGTPLNATNLNKIENGVKTAQDDANIAIAAAAAAQVDADKGVLAYDWRDSSYTLYMNGNEALTTTHKFLYHIPNLVEFANGCEIIDVRAFCLDPSSSGNVTLALKKNSVSILTTNITIEAGETSSLTATTQPIIDESKKNFVIGDQLLAECTGAGVGVTHCNVEIILRPLEA